MFEQLKVESPVCTGLFPWHSPDGCGAGDAFEPVTATWYEIDMPARQVDQGLLRRSALARGLAVEQLGTDGLGIGVLLGR